MEISFFPLVQNTFNAPALIRAATAAALRPCQENKTWGSPGPVSTAVFEGTVRDHGAGLGRLPLGSSESSGSREIGGVNMLYDPGHEAQLAVFYLGKFWESVGPLDVPALISHSEGYFDGRKTMESWTQIEKADLSHIFLGANNQLNTFWTYSANECTASEPGVDQFPASSGLPSVVEREIAEFSEGVDGLCPTSMAIRLARDLCEVALQYVQHPEISLDIDGELSFDLRLNDGRLVFAELGLDGQLDVGVYGSDNRMLAHNAKATYKYFLSIIKP